MSDSPIVDDPNSPGTARAYELYRGLRLQEVGTDTDPGTTDTYSTDAGTTDTQSTGADRTDTET
jgi:hypothetical protein